MFYEEPDADDSADASPARQQNRQNQNQRPWTTKPAHSAAASPRKRRVETDFKRLNRMLAGQCGHGQPGAAGRPRQPKSRSATPPAPAAASGPDAARRAELASRVTVKHGRELLDARRRRANAGAPGAVRASPQDRLFTPDATVFGWPTEQSDHVGDVMAFRPDHDLEQLASAVDQSMNIGGGVNDSFASAGSSNAQQRRKPGMTKSQAMRVASTQKKLHPGPDLPGCKLKQFSPERVKSRVHGHARGGNSPAATGMGSGSPSRSSWHVVSKSEARTPHDNNNTNNNNDNIPIDDAPWSPPPPARGDAAAISDAASDTPSFAGFSEIAEQETLREEDFERTGDRGTRRQQKQQQDQQQQQEQQQQHKQQHDHTQQQQSYRTHGSQRSGFAPADPPGHTGRGGRRPGSASEPPFSTARSGSHDLNDSRATIVPEIRLNDPQMVSHRRREARPVRR
jgi:hypothetical protein